MANRIPRKHLGMRTVPDDTGNIMSIESALRSAQELLFKTRPDDLYKKDRTFVTRDNPFAGISV